MTSAKRHILLSFSVIFSCLLALSVGPDGFDVCIVQRALNDETAALILFEIRMPRIAAALLAGWALGLAGAAMQGLLRNPLAEPGTMGVSASAALAATMVVYLGIAGAAGWAMPLASAAGAMAATVLVGALALRQASTATLLLAGIALSALAGALMGMLVNLAPNPFSLSDLINWTAGSVANRDWNHVLYALPLIGAGSIALLPARSALSALLFGDEVAHSVGVDLVRTRLLVIAGTGLLTGGAVAIAGMIGFVGLIAPHFARMAVGHDAGKLLLPSAIIAALMLMWADMAIRFISWGPEWHLGTLTALIGAPLFAFIALKTQGGRVERT